MKNALCSNVLGIGLSLLSLCFVATSAQAYTIDEDVPPAIQTQLVNDLNFMTTLKGNGATGLHKKIFGNNVDGTTYKHFFETRISAIGMDDCGSGPAVACVQPFLDSTKMWITQNYIKFSHPQIARLMVLYHESRHTEGSNGYWSHATCPTPFLDDSGQDMKSIWTGAPLAGEPACDRTPFGSYGSSTILLKNVQKYCTNCTTKVRMDAGIYSDNQLGRITDSNAKNAMKRDFASNSNVRPRRIH